MKEIDGDLVELALQGRFDIIIHGCNCFCTMGAGIARQIKETFPDAYEADKETKYGDRMKLGTFSTGVGRNNLLILNAYTQFMYGGTCDVDYDAVKKVFHTVFRFYAKKNLTFGIPRIGAGLAGGTWDIIKSIIEKEMKDEDITLVNYKKETL